MYIDNLAYLDSVRPARVLGFGRGEKGSEKRGQSKNTVLSVLYFYSDPFSAALPPFLTHLFPGNRGMSLLLKVKDQQFFLYIRQYIVNNLLELFLNAFLGCDLLILEQLC